MLISYRKRSASRLLLLAGAFSIAISLYLWLVNAFLTSSLMTFSEIQQQNFEQRTRERAAKDLQLRSRFWDSLEVPEKAKANQIQYLYVNPGAYFDRHTRRLAPLANVALNPIVGEVVAFMEGAHSAQVSSLGIAEVLMGSMHVNNKRVLITSMVGHGFETAFAFLFSARVIGKWTDSIILISDDASSVNRGALHCLNVQLVIVLPRSLATYFSLPLSLITASLYSVVPLLLPFLESTEVLCFISCDHILTGKIPSFMARSSDNRSQILFDLTINGTNANHLGMYTMGAPGAELLRPFFTNARVQRKRFGRLLRRQFHDAGLQFIKLLSSESRQVDTHDGLNSYTYFNGTWPGKQERFNAQINNRSDIDLFANILARRLFKCPTLESHSALVARPLPTNLHAIAIYGSIFVKLVVDEQFPLFYRKVLSKARGERKRAMTHWATKEFVETAYTIIFQERVIGGWSEDIILITDEISPIHREALDCLQVEIVTYSPHDFQARFPWAKQNVWYYKLLPYILPSLRDYDVIQYLDLDVVLMGPLVKRSPEDFEDDVVLIMDDNKYPQPILWREFIWHKIENANDKHPLVKRFTDRFPGSLEQNNGPNKSPSAGAFFIALLSARLESPDVVLEKFRDVAESFAEYFDYGDQPLVMFSFWGRWRMKYGLSVWDEEYSQMFDTKIKHKETGLHRAYLHTTGDKKPSLPSSPYHAFDVLTKLMSAELLHCPSILVNVSMSR